jgi:hypothetical protein
MKTYSIYAKENDTAAADAIFLSDGFSWGGFVFTWVWALWNRMWIVAVVVLAVTSVASLLPPVQEALLILGINLIMGLHGNDLLGWSLSRRGYSEIGLSHGSSLEEAELRFYSGETKTSAVPASTPVDHDTLGLFGVRS